MSTWYKTNEDDINIDREKDEVFIFVTQDFFGSTYKTLTFKQIEEIYKAIKEE